MKFCKMCSETKPVDSFHKSSVSKDGLYVWCKECSSAQKKAYNSGRKAEKAESLRHWREANKEYVSQRGREYREVHREEISARMREYRRANRSQERMRLAKYRALKSEATIQTLPPNIWDLLLEAYGTRCMVPGCAKTDLTLDHVVPLSRGGTHSWENFQILCKSCNSSKGAHHSTDYRPSLAEVQ